MNASRSACRTRSDRGPTRKAWSLPDPTSRFTVDGLTFRIAATSLTVSSGLGLPRMLKVTIVCSFLPPHKREGRWLYNMNRQTNRSANKLFRCPTTAPPCQCRVSPLRRMSQGVSCFGSDTLTLLSINRTRLSWSFYGLQLRHIRVGKETSLMEGISNNVSCFCCW